MADIKTKKPNAIKIKKQDKAKIYTQKLKNNIVKLKEKEDLKNEKQETAIEYGINRIMSKTSKITYNCVDNFNKYGNRATRNIKNKIQDIAIKRKTKNIKEKIKKMQKDNKSKTKIRIKSIPNNAKYKLKKKTEEIKKAREKTKKIYKITKTTTKNIKRVIKATITTIKAIIATTKALISILLAGGWLAVVIIILICLIALICSSIYGIFFSSEKGVGNITMNTVINELNIEVTNKITEIQKNNEYDEYKILSNRAEWKDILSIYTVLISNGNEQSNVITLDENKIEKLKGIFWEMNIITSRIEIVEIQIENTDEKVTKKILYIDITSISVEEMIQKYNFNNKQKEQLKELQKEEYTLMWAKVINGSSSGSTDIVQVAFSQIGNIGGQPFWSWYGYNSRVEWCACFVSWCANECGYIEKGIIPKFANCQNEGVAWFKTCGLWKDRGHFPKAGDIIFFDWADSNDGQADHVGIVEKFENGKVYTIEGNTKGDVCKQNIYDVNSSVILGYGTPNY